MSEEATLAAERVPIFGPELIRDPYSIYRRLRESSPVHQDGNDWMLFRYADIVSVIRDPRLAAARIHPSEEWLEETGLGPLFHAHARMMLFTDPPDHTRLRGLVNRAFTPRAVEVMRADIQRIVDGMLDEAQERGRGRIELIADLAYPLPVTVIAQMLGVPLDMREQFKRWSEGIAAFIGGTTAPEMEMLGEALRCVEALSDFFRTLADERRRHPQADMLSALVAAEDQGDRLSEDELIANCILLLVAGHETTTNLIGNGMLALLRHPDQLELLRSNPNLIGSAVEELLRYDSPVQGTSRLAVAELQIGEHTIKPGQNVSLMFGSANRDPAQFPDPDRLDITRREIRHLSFSHGAHFCVGAPLARLEGQIAISTLLRRMPELRLASEELEWRDNFTLRGLKALPLAY